MKRKNSKILSGGITTPVASAWVFPIVLVQKNVGKSRMWVDYRSLSQKKKPDRFPIPNIEEILEDLHGGPSLTTLDLFSRYWQIPIFEECEDMTICTCKFVTFRFKDTPLGLKNARATFQRTMNEVLKVVDFYRVYLDDIIIFSKSEEGHVKEVSEVLNK